MPTRDGVSDRDWSVVKSLALNIAKMSEQDADTSDMERELHKYLDWLEQKYGEMPSILATRAEYTDNARDAVALYEKAYASACIIKCNYEKSYISLSIAELYIVELKEVKAGKYWLRLLERNMNDFADNYILEAYDTLRRKIA